MKKLLYTIFTILCLSLIFTNKAWCPSIGGSIIGSQTSFTGLVQVSGQTATFNTIWLNGVPLSNVTGHTVEDEGVSLYPRTLLNFVGAGVTAADDGVDTTTVTIPGGGVGATAWTDIGDSTGDTVIDLAGWLTQFTSTMDAANGYVFDIYDSDADLANDTYLMKLRYLDNGDANGLFLGCFDNQTDAKFIVGLEGSLWTASYLYGICDPLIVHQGNTNTTRYYLWAWNNSTTGTFAMTYWKDITGTLNSYLQYNWNGSLKTAFWGDGSISVSDITGVKISGDSDGAITFKGQGDGADEDITMNLDDTADTIVFTSSTGVNLLNFSAFAISGATFNSGSGAMDLGDAAVANGDTDSLPTCDGVYDFLYTELPSGADPDVNTAGEVGRDTDDHWLRGYDGAAQFIYGQKAKIIAFTACNPDLLTDADFVPIWTNRTGATFNITAIYSFSDVDDADYILKYSTNATYDFTNLTEIEPITISTNGTGVFYNEKAVGDINDTTVETGKTIGFDASADDVDYIHGVIVGYLDGDIA